MAGSSIDYPGSYKLTRKKPMSLSENQVDFEYSHTIHGMTRKHKFSAKTRVPWYHQKATLFSIAILLILISLVWALFNSPLIINNLAETIEEEQEQTDDTYTANHDTKIQMAKQIQHLEEMIQEKDQKIKENEEMIQEKETKIHNAENKLQEMNKHCTDELEKQKNKFEEQQLIHRNDIDAQLAAISKMLDEITLVKEDVNHRLTNISSRVSKLVADSSKSRKNQEAKDLYDRRQVLPKLVEGVENKMYETKRERSINVEETKAIKDKDQEQYQKDEMADQKAAEMNFQEMNLNEQAPAKKHEVTKKSTSTCGSSMRTSPEPAAQDRAGDDDSTSDDSRQL